MKINLLIESFKSNNSDREKEYITCLKENIKNVEIDEIHIFNNNIDFVNKLIEENDKIISIENTNRMTYKDFFDYSNEYLKDEISIIANADIIIEESIKYIRDIKIENFFLCLTRYDIQKNGTTTYPPNHFGTQDTWIYKAPIISKNSDFYLGRLGCDNRIPYIMEQNGYKVSNPSKQIITKHLHLTGYRTYNKSNIIMGEYIYMVPTGDINILSKKRYVYNDNGIIKYLK
tara:strand:- start:10984 stop:11676 length:693 start_codon:yes stop_codon:yes gene_type:complete